MWDEIIRVATTNGLWALLFCSLFIFQIKDGKSREKKYQETIDSLCKSLHCVQEIDENVEHIRDEMRARLDGARVTK
ncbi:MAG: BhlA/UviB family holin-like peptide [Clostridia bacterium]